MAVRACNTDEDYGAWDRFVANFPRAHYFQTYGWLKSYEPMGFTPHLLVCEADGMITGGVAFLSAKIPLLPWQIVIIPHGPLPAHPDAPSWLPLMQRLDAICRQRNVIYAQLYPHELSGQRVLLPCLEELGFTSSAMLTCHQFSSTPLTIDLVGKTEQDLLSSFRARTRTYVRRALSSQLMLRTEVDPLIFDKIYELFLENSRLKCYQPRPYASLRMAWDWFAPKEWATILQAWHDETLAGAILLIFTGRTAYYVAGAVRRGYAEQRPAEFMHWHGIIKAIERQLEAYDLGNFGTTGVEQFKRGFRSEHRVWHDPRTKLYSPVMSRLASTADRHLGPLLRGLARRRVTRSV
jgi:lipid II:glycine glycyltransferase (peptidoglycan interpeptide bridge formation enzyme)